MQSQACSDPIYRSAGIMQIYQQSGFRFSEARCFSQQEKIRSSIDSKNLLELLIRI